MIVPAVKRAFAKPKPGESHQQQPAAAAKPAVSRGGLEILYCARLDVGLFDAIATPDGQVVAAATADGALAFLDGSDGRILTRSDEAHDDPPNMMLFMGESIVRFDEDGCTRTVEVATGKTVHVHAVAEPAEEGKRQRCSPINRAIVLDDEVYVAAAGRLLHACRAADGVVQHALEVTSPVRALCAASTSDASSDASSWAYAVALAGSVRLVSRAGEAMRELTTDRMVRSLIGHGPWLAAGAMDGVIELWDVVTPKHANARAHHALKGFCGSDGYHLGWRADGGALVVSGQRAAVFDFTGANPPHPYRGKRGEQPAKAGQPDAVPRVCMADGAVRVSWAPRHRALDVSDNAPPTGTNACELATLDKDGVVRLWNPHGLPLRKGGNGDPARPQMMKPQFYTWPKHDGCHPTGEVSEACSLLWLGDDKVAVGYFCGEVVAWRVVG
jgi:hypothetical protein